MATLDPGSALRALLGANVQFVVVGEPESEGCLRVVVSAHPTNLDALGRALDRLSATVRVDDGAPTQGPRDAPSRLGDPLGTVTVETAAGPLRLLVGARHGSLYADTVTGSEERQIAGLGVRWAPEPVEGATARATGRVIGGRLLSLAGRIVHLMERRAEPGEGAPLEPPDATEPGDSSPGSDQEPTSG